jgi:hypothetical protein
MNGADAGVLDRDLATDMAVRVASMVGDLAIMAVARAFMAVVDIVVDRASSSISVVHAGNDDDRGLNGLYHIAHTQVRKSRQWQ